MPSLRQRLTERDLSFYKADWFAQQARHGRVLDIPAGSGTDTRPLLELGYEVISADLVPEFFDRKIEGARCLKADMEAALPFQDETFDYVLCSEGIEHLADQLAFARECSRVLRPGGKLAVTTPNLLSLRARVAFMLTGNRAFKSWVDEVTSVWGIDEKTERLYHGHAFLINYFQLRYLLWHAGLRTLDVVGTRYSPSSIALLPLVPFVWLFTRRASKKARRRNPDPSIYRDSFRHVFSSSMLLSTNLFVVAEKLTDEERQAPVWVEKHRENFRRRVAAASAAGKTET